MRPPVTPVAFVYVAPPFQAAWRGAMNRTPADTALAEKGFGSLRNGFGPPGEDRLDPSRHSIRRFATDPAPGASAGERTRQ